VLDDRLDGGRQAVPGVVGGGRPLHVADGTKPDQLVVLCDGRLARSGPNRIRCARRRVG
jgi:hypothetical protein